ncbi:MAG: substrate-binding domain-containing protein [Verrucomicrobia bacterium]|nr:substrate-binding domain-containing protein [Verrucomicrobiota bacterium]
MRSLNRTSLHLQIVDILRDEIVASAKPRQRLEGEVHLAKRFGVSSVTISKALAVLTQEGLIERQSGSGTYVRDRSARQHVAILVGFDIASPRTSFFYLRTIQMLRARFEGAGYRVRLYADRLQLGNQPVDLTYAELMEDVIQNRVCGVASIATLPHPSWIKPLRERRIPVVGDARRFPFGVRVDHGPVALEGTRYLLRQGRRMVALLAWQGWNKDQLDQIAPFRQAMHEVGAPVHECWIKGDVHPALVGAGWEGFKEIWHARKEKPDGLVVSDDMFFTDVAVAIKDLGIRVPEQLMVVSFANKGSGIFFPFPTVRMEMDPDEHAQALSDLLVRLIRRVKIAAPKIDMSFRLVEPVASHQLSVISRQ